MISWRLNWFSSSKEQRMNFQNQLILIASLAIATCFSGCHAEPAVAPRADVQASSSGTNLRTIQSFPRKSVKIGAGGNKFFLWKLKSDQQCPSRSTLPADRPLLGPCPDDVAFVLNASNCVLGDPQMPQCTQDGLIALDDRTFLIQAEENRIRGLVTAKAIPGPDGAIVTADGIVEIEDTTLPQYQSGLATLSTQLTSAKAQRDDKQKQLDAETSKPTSEQDPNLIAQLKSDIQTLDTKIASIQKRIDSTNAKITALQAIVAQVSQAGLDADLVTFRARVKDRNDISAVSDAVLQQIKDRTDFYDYSDNLTVAFSFDGSGAISIDIQGWDFRIPGDSSSPEGEKSFSTSDGTITGVSYVELGGTFEFDVHAYDGVYHFKVSRARYGAQDGLTHFQGEIIRHGFLDTDLKNPRRGVAVMDEPVSSKTALHH
jgi:hypothetical protein